MCIEERFTAVLRRGYSIVYTWGWNNYNTLSQGKRKENHTNINNNNNTRDYISTRVEEGRKGEG